MEYLLSIITGGLGGAILTGLLRSWITVRLKESIKNEYATELETYKAELNSKVESIKHDNEVSQLRTSLFFDHQRNAFAALIAKIAEVNREWMKDYTPDDGLRSSVPSNEYHELEELLYIHQLFLDDECLMAMTLVMEAYSRSIVPNDQNEEDFHHENDEVPVLNYVEYLQPRIASIFRNKIGVQSDSSHLREVAILAAMKIINSYSTYDFEIPATFTLITGRHKIAAEIVALGELNFAKLKDMLKNIDNHFSQNPGQFLEIPSKTKLCLKVLAKFDLSVTSKV